MQWLEQKNLKSSVLYWKCVIHQCSQKNNKQDLDNQYHTHRLLHYKIEYYLAHDDEREEIAHNGYLKVKEHYTFEKCLKKILDTVFDEVD